MGNLLIKENAVLIRNMTAAEISHYASIELGDDPVSTSLIEHGEETLRQLRLELNEAQIERDNIEDDLRDVQDEFEDAVDDTVKTKTAIREYLDTFPPQCAELEKLREIVK